MFLLAVACYQVNLCFLRRKVAYVRECPVINPRGILLRVFSRKEVVIYSLEGGRGNYKVKDISKNLKK